MPTQYDFLHEIGVTLQFSNTWPLMRVVERYVGGFGEVYIIESCDEARPGRFAAKTLRSDSTLDATKVELFQHEAILWSKIPPHPNILPCGGTGMYNKRPYVFTKFIEPEAGYPSSLGGMMKVQRATDRQFVQYLLSLLSALAHLEEHMPEFSHGDIKPDNVLIEAISAYEGRPAHNRLWLTDFGLSRAATLSSLKAGVYGGDLRYLPPEVLNEGHYEGRTVDMHCLGVSCWELLTGVPYYTFDPPVGGRVAMFANRRDEFLRRARPDLHGEFIQVVSKLLSSDPTARPISFVTLQQRLEDVARSLSIIKEYPAVTPHDQKNWFLSAYEEKIERFLASQYGMSAEQVDRFTSALDEATNYVHVGLGEEALDILDGLEKEAVGLAAIFVVKTSAYGRMGATQEALTSCVEAWTIFEQHPEQKEVTPSSYLEVLISLPQLLAYLPEKRVRDVGLTCALKAVEISPSNPRALMALGRALIALKRYSEAEQVLLDALNLDPRNRFPIVWLVVARSLQAIEPLSTLEADTILSNEEKQIAKNVIIGISSWDGSNEVAEDKE